ncbi:hypothetical protein BG015_008337 [Linnemannia schmuckeri]|uniref:Uncharacterized protein n=1 Tax=Linnemannia schmuckeri TaxID=64567 RepID=A0A9P5RZM8_9FUNG|nr:hypothetical protein BG015_008337 [Linnemannia schmuckeri]
MRIPTIVLLSSVALSLLVNAENAPAAPTADVAAGATPIAANVAAATPVADNVGAATPIAANVAAATPVAANVVAEAKPEVVTEATSPLKMEEDGNGKVFTKTTVAFDDTNKEVKNKEEADFKAQGLLDIDLGGDGHGKHHHHHHDDWFDDWFDDDWFDENHYNHYIHHNHYHLFGDKDYWPRPVPKGCPELSFYDQMIWDQQRYHGIIHRRRGPLADASGPSPIAADVDNKDAEADNDTEAEMKDAPPAPAAPADPAAAVVEDKDVGKTDETVDSKGLHLCILGDCDHDEHEHDHDDHHHHHNGHHKLSRFLRQFRGKALRIDSRGCPLPYKH